MIGASGRGRAGRLAVAVERPVGRAGLDGAGEHAALEGAAEGGVERAVVVAHGEVGVEAGNRRLRAAGGGDAPGVLRLAHGDVDRSGADRRVGRQAQVAADQQAFRL